MKVYVVVLFFLVRSSLEANQPTSCSCLEDKECLTSSFNQLSLRGITEDLETVLSAYDDNISTTEVIDYKEDLSSCRSRISLLKDQMVNLERMYDRITADDQWWNNDGTVEEEDEPKIPSTGPVDCKDLQGQYGGKTGVYEIYPYHDAPNARSNVSVKVLCDLELDGGGWTVFLTRQPQLQPLDFNETWINFKQWFGDVNAEYWLGNELIHTLTSRGSSEMRIDVEDFSGNKMWAQWNVFSVADENNKYRLTLDKYDPRSTMGDILYNNNHMKFTTFDNDNDLLPENCAIYITGVNPPVGQGGWWYGNCGSARPTAPLKDTGKWDSAWFMFYNAKDEEVSISVKTLSMKFRRRYYDC